MNILLKLFLFITILFYGVLLFFSFKSPEKIEKSASFFIKYQLKKELKNKIDTFQSNKSILNKFAKKIINENEIKIKTLEVLENKIPSIIKKMQDRTCDCRQKYKKFIANFVQEKISLLKNATEKLTDFLKYKYMEIVQNLIIDIRIFLGSNLLIFSLLFLFLFAKPKANLQILFVCSLLIISSLISSYFYIFEQDWFFTIVYNDYMGYFYIFYVGILFFFLWDIFLNKARITTEIVNTILNALGSSLGAVPC